MNRKILVVNPGSTSTKIAVYETAKQDTEKQPHEAFSETLRHNAEEPQSLGAIADQLQFRKQVVTDALKENTSIECDIAMIPIGGTYTMNPREAASFINDLKPPVVIPTHYGSIVGKPSDVVEFEKNVGPQTEVVRKL